MLAKNYQNRLWFDKGVIVKNKMVQFLTYMVIRVDCNGVTFLTKVQFFHRQVIDDLLIGDQKCIEKCNLVNRRLTSAIKLI